MYLQQCNKTYAIKYVCKKYLHGSHICGNLLEFVHQQVEKWNNK